MGLSMARHFTLVFLLAVLCIGAGAQDYSNSSSYGSSNSSSSRFGRSSYNSSSSDGSSGSSSSGPFSKRTSSSTQNSTNQNQRTDQDTRSERQKRLDERKKGSNQPGTAGAKDAKATGQKTVQGKKPEAKKPSSTGGEARGATNVEFKMKANPSTNVLFIEQLGQIPTMNISVTKGDSFATRVAFSNARHSQFDRFEISIRYDPQVIRPTGIDDSGISDLLKEPGAAKVDRRRGIVTYRAEFESADTQKPETLIKLQWKALSASAHSPLTFSTTTDHPSRILRGSVNVLHQVDEDNAPLEVSERTGLLDASVAVAPDSKTLADTESSENSFEGMGLARSISKGSAEGGVTLALRSSQNSVAQSEEFLVDIVYSNPKRSEIDSVNLRVRFDPKVLQVVDFDENNWITRGVNIHDGDYHEDLPFDFQVKNQAYNSAGLIEYQMGFASKARIPSSGVIATVKFKAISAAPSTEIGFELNEDERNPKTSLSFLGFNLIGVPGERATALHSATLTVQ
jgi:hypothetical protein